LHYKKGREKYVKKEAACSFCISKKRRGKESIKTLFMKKESEESVILLGRLSGRRRKGFANGRAEARRSPPSLTRWSKKEVKNTLHAPNPSKKKNPP